MYCEWNKFFREYIIYFCTIFIFLSIFEINSCVKIGNRAVFLTHCCGVQTWVTDWLQRGTSLQQHESVMQLSFQQMPYLVSSWKGNLTPPAGFWVFSQLWQLLHCLMCPFIFVFTVRPGSLFGKWIELPVLSGFLPAKGKKVCVVIL